MYSNNKANHTRFKVGSAERKLAMMMGVGQVVREWKQTVRWHPQCNSGIDGTRPIFLGVHKL